MDSYDTWCEVLNFKENINNIFSSYGYEALSEGSSYNGNEYSSIKINIWNKSIKYYVAVLDLRYDNNNRYFIDFDGYRTSIKYRREEDIINVINRIRLIEYRLIDIKKKLKNNFFKVTYGTDLANFKINYCKVYVHRGEILFCPSSKIDQFRITDIFSDVEDFIRYLRKNYPYIRKKWYNYLKYI